jgi:hypothetical protein
MRRRSASLQPQPGDRTVVFTNVVTTHTWEERWETLSMVREAGMEVCCGGSALVNESHCCRQADPGRAAGDHRGFPGQKRHFDHAHA